MAKVLDNKVASKLFIAVALGFFVLGHILGSRSAKPEVQVKYQEKVVYKDRIVYKERNKAVETKITKPDGTIKEVKSVESAASQDASSELATITEVVTKVVIPSYSVTGGLGSRIDELKPLGLLNLELNGPGAAIVSDFNVGHAAFLTYTLHYK